MFEPMYAYINMTPKIYPIFMWKLDWFL